MQAGSPCLLELGGLKNPIHRISITRTRGKILARSHLQSWRLSPWPQSFSTTKCAHPRLSHNPIPLMFEQHIDSDILFHHDDVKVLSQNLYLQQPHTVIQLVELPSPPPRRISSVIYSSSAASSSSSSSSFEQHQEEEESIHSSYCSSDDVPLDEMELPISPRNPDSLSGRMKRILLWREQSPQLISGIHNSVS